MGCEVPHPKDVGTHRLSTCCIFRVFLLHSLRRQMVEIDNSWLLIARGVRTTRAVAGLAASTLYGFTQLKSSRRLQVSPSEV